jgi:hypothetical protein
MIEPRKQTGPVTTPAPPQQMPPPSSTTQSIPQGDDPRRIGDLLACWVGVKLAEVDDLVDEARSRVDAIPNLRNLWALFGELVVRVHFLESEVERLKGARR